MNHLWSLNLREVGGRSSIYSGIEIISYWGDADTYFRRDTENGIGLEADEWDSFIVWWEKVTDACNNPLFDNI